ncbi:MAG: porin family protein [Alphaproteobacteria bacterium]|jgi:opacity protein-like surface antigen|nr:porin family protein [Alphaproteobacteria bacterium]
MKKILLPLLAMTAVSTAEATPFNGFFLGAQAGIAKRITTTSLSNQTLTVNGATVTEVDYSKKNRSTGFVYGLMGGYGRNLNGLYLGGELSVNFSQNNKNQTQSVLGTNGSTYSVNTQYKHGPTLTFAPRAGAVFANSYLAYVRLGLAVSRDQIQNYDVTTGNSFNSSKKTKLTFVPGVGIEKDFGNHMLLRLEYTYNTGSQLSGDSTGVYQARQNMKYSAHALKLGVSWQF